MSVGYDKEFDPFQPYAVIDLAKVSDWECRLFGAVNGGLVWRPNEGEVPNAFWRWMQFLAFGNRWKRIAPLSNQGSEE